MNISTWWITRVTLNQMCCVEVPTSTLHLISWCWMGGTHSRKPCTNHASWTPSVAPVRKTTSTWRRKENYGDERIKRARGLIILLNFTIAKCPLSLLFFFLFLAQTLTLLFKVHDWCICATQTPMNLWYTWKYFDTRSLQGVCNNNILTTRKTAQCD